MTEDLLEAECVISHLHSQKIILLKTWQNQHPNDQNYSVYFDHPGTVGDIGLSIVKRSGKYYIPRSLIKILSYRHRFDAARIYSECAIA